jgi:hypothetical protein
MTTYKIEKTYDYSPELNDTIESGLTYQEAVEVLELETKLVRSNGGSIIHHNQDGLMWEEADGSEIYTYNIYEQEEEDEGEGQDPEYYEEMLKD